MSNAGEPPGNAKPPPALISGDIFANIPQLVYLLYLLGFIFHPAALVGLVLAFVNRDGASPLARSHYDFQISTFWRGLIIAVVGVVTLFIVVGWLVLLFWAVWTIVRCIKGLNNLSRGLPMPADLGWRFG
jgi:uncharacterized membrane protein